MHRTSEERAKELIKKLKLDKSVVEGFSEWLLDIVKHGDFGTSGTVEPGKSVVKMIAERLPVTIKLNLLAITFAYALAVIIGVYSARYADGSFDHAAFPAFAIQKDQRANAVNEPHSKCKEEVDRTAPDTHGNGQRNGGGCS